MCDPPHRIPPAFSHFSYHHSGVVVCDLQGVRSSTSYLLTDPVIHSDTRLRFGPTDFGPEGVSLFFSTHVCNDVCSGFRRPPPAAKLLAARLTRVIRELMTMIVPLLVCLLLSPGTTLAGAMMGTLIGILVSDPALIRTPIGYLMLGGIAVLVPVGIETFVSWVSPLILLFNVVLGTRAATRSQVALMTSVNRTLTVPLPPELRTVTTAAPAGAAAAEPDLYS